MAFVLAGFVAQIIDGTLGMAYGVTLTSLLAVLGFPPAHASALVHLAELVTTGVSGLSHWKAGNVGWPVARALIVPGVIGGAIGAYVLSSLDGVKIKPFVSGYLVLMGLLILYRSVRGSVPGTAVPLGPLGLAGGFVDAIGGGGWGPVVTSTLVANGGTPRFVIGSVNLAEWFVTAAESVAFVLALGSGQLLEHWPVILGLLVGGALAAPLAARVTRRVPTRPLMFAVGLLVIVLNVRSLLG